MFFFVPFVDPKFLFFLLSTGKLNSTYFFCQSISNFLKSSSFYYILFIKVYLQKLCLKHKFFSIFQLFRTSFTHLFLILQILKSKDYFWEWKANLQVSINLKSKVNFYKIKAVSGIDKLKPIRKSNQRCSLQLETYYFKTKKEKKCN